MEQPPIQSSNDNSAASATTASREQRPQQDNDDDDQCLYYFGYGPIVNELVRRRRGIDVVEVQAAYVPDYRLTFAFGGIASIVQKTGFEVHGLLMKLKSVEVWKKLREFEAGNAPAIRTVVPYSAMQNSACSDDEEHSHNADDDFRGYNLSGSIQAYLIEHPANVDDTIWETPIERLPQERYLKLIAQGMRQYQVDEDYVTDHIEACPFIPTRTPSEYRVFPSVKRPRKLTLDQYEKLCLKGNSVEGDLYFCISQQIFRLGEHDPSNPLATWFLTHGHGKPDCTFYLHQLVVDPNIPFCENASELQDIHYQWAENHLVEMIEQYGMHATRVYELVVVESKRKKKGTANMAAADDDSSSETNATPKQTRSCCCGWMVRLWRRNRNDLDNPLASSGTHTTQSMSMRFSTMTVKTTAP